MQVLQRVHVDFSALEGGDAFGGGAGCGERCDGGDTRGDGGAAYCLFVEPWFETSGRVDDEMDALTAALGAPT